MKYSTATKINLIKQAMARRNMTLFEEIKFFTETHTFLFGDLERFILKHRLGLYHDKKPKSLKHIASMLKIPVSKEDKINLTKKSYNSAIEKIAQRFDFSHIPTNSDEETCSN